jgi:outer membrane protein assembly factor BamD (BamD/ComL family)
MYSHETYARSHQICLDLIRRYPHSPTVPYALMLAAIDDLHLCHFNNWWREENDRHSYFAECLALKARLTHDYPRHHLAQKVRENARIFPEDRNLRWQTPRTAAIRPDGGETTAVQE